MNKLAKEYGLKNTTFSNAHGLTDKNNMSTSEDICILSCIAL